MLFGKSALVIDNSGLSRRALELQLSFLGMKVHAVSSLEEGLLMVRSHPDYDVILLSPQVTPQPPDWAIHKLRTAVGGETPIFSLLSPIQNDARASGDSTLYTDYIYKPVKVTQLCKKISKRYTSTPDCEETVSLETVAALYGDEQKKMQILLAEDNLVNQKVALGMLKRAGYTADVVINGAEAVEAVLGKNYHLVLMDIHMPHMDGLEATQRIQQLLGDADRPQIVAMTASIMEDDLEKYREAGMDDFLPKPVNYAQFMEVLRRTRARAKFEEQLARKSKELIFLG